MAENNSEREARIEILSLAKAKLREANTNGVQPTAPYAKRQR